ncbi:hypothetical protein AURDEDRAFT_173402 [Auricularia subglabra TFB-10046 SS5]|uniref:Lysine-specific metallo-endopeptidase domain-containing protein n=1 Tax=Auricularia subglabra (strain TFB-10046 / SS5) TaxID=717982 RepID=J0D003_AURST|nr:hypothetical protein AURDEDRAFT_173402 [Auricularia subglabra TFB-10046 SS5]
MSRSPKTLMLSGMIVLAMAAHVSATPRPVLLPRDAKNFVDCSASQKTKINTALADAAKLANIAATEIDRSSTAFKHYLRDEDGDSAVKMWSMVAANNDPTNPPYSLAITDAAPQDGDTLREMKICPRFFSPQQRETKNDLNSKKYDKGKRGSWCQDGQHFRDFETAGHTILHEMTHLDALGKAAGVDSHQDASGLTTHGTDDVGGFGNEYVSAAREFLDAWVDDPGSLDPNAIKPWQNAENLAAAATEWWFIKQCGFTNIDL